MQDMLQAVLFPGAERFEAFVHSVVPAERMEDVERGGPFAVKGAPALGVKQGWLWADEESLLALAEPGLWP